MFQWQNEKLLQESLFLGPGFSSISPTHINRGKSKQPIIKR